MRDLRELEIEGSSAPVTDDLVHRFEQLVGIKLPGDYVAFLKRINGGNPRLDTFDLPDGQQWAISTIYHLALNEHDEFDVLGALRMLEHALPHGVIPIGCDGGDNQTCLDLRPGAQMQVIIWDHEVELPNGFQPAARSFEEVIDSLYLNPDYE